MHDKLLREVDALQKELGFSGRSDIIRAGLRSLLTEERSKSRLADNVEVVLIVANLEKSNEEVSQIRHKFNEIIKTEMHNHLENDRCLHIFLINGTAEKVREMVRLFQISRKVEYTKLFVS